MITDKKVLADAIKVIAAATAEGGFYKVVSNPIQFQELVTIEPKYKPLLEDDVVVPKRRTTTDGTRVWFEAPLGIKCPKSHKMGDSYSAVVVIEATRDYANDKGEVVVKSGAQFLQLA